MPNSKISIRSLLVAAASLSLAPVRASKTDVPFFAYERESLRDKDVPAKHGDLLGFHGSAPQLRPGQCRPHPGDKAWPSKREWDALDEALSGALVKTVPLAAPCFHDWGVYDAEKCEAVTRDWNSPYLHIDDPTSIMWPVWEGRSCLPTDNADEASCTLGAYPVYAVNATNVAQIQLAVNFARNKGLRLVIKNTGHDYQAKSSGAGSLSIWTHHLRDINFLENYKLGAFSGNALHVGAGVLTGDLVQAAHNHDASFVGGMCASVGFAGGYYSGGGHSPLSSVYGLGADHVLAVNLVTADGQFVTATEKTNADLFWALRGGGPSTFGVTTSVVVRLQPQMHATSSRISFQTSEHVSNETFWKGAKAFFELFEDLTKAGVYTPVNILRNSEWYNGSSDSLSARPMLAPKKTEEEFNKLIKPLFDSLKKLGIPFENDTRFFTSYQSAFTDSWPADDLFVASPDDIQASWLFPKSLWKNKKAFEKAFKSIRYVSDSGYDVGAFGIAPGNPFNVDNAANPALRKAMAFVSTGVVLPENPTAKQLAAAQDKVMNDLVQSWREAAPISKQGGSYLNEGNVREPDWKQAFYGKNYPRLLRLKDKWDPKGVFYATAGVGSERWEVRTKEQGIQTQNGPLCRI